MATRHWLLACVAALAFACGGKSGSNTDGGGSGSGDGDGGIGDGDGGIGDGDGGVTGDGSGSNAACVPGNTQCSNCVDDDGDGYTDGNDPQCTGAVDDLENSFATGTPGDNVDATNQDCFFDGNSGAGNDGCNQHVCCFLHAGGATTATNDDQSECATLAPNANENMYVRANCYAPFGSTPVPQQCQDTCGPLAPPGCDCFGCCTVCNGTSCADILISNSLNCPQDNLSDPSCITCQKTADCGASECAYDGVSCTPCPGQCTDPNNPSTCDPPLPSSCSGMTTCPNGYADCSADGVCATGTYCSQGCCIGIIQ